MADSEQRAITWIDGKWIDGNPPLLGPMTHATWMASVVFDGARYFEGVTPDLDLHCQRLVDSAEEFGLKPDAVSGRCTSSPLMIRELRERTDIPVYNNVIRNLKELSEILL